MTRHPPPGGVGITIGAVRCRQSGRATETRVPIAAKPGQPARVDYEYKRNGTANLFMMFAPLEGWRQVRVTERHAAIDYAHVLKELSDTHWGARSDAKQPGIPIEASR
jgi:hypothetical protein